MRSMKWSWDWVYVKNEKMLEGLVFSLVYSTLLDLYEAASMEVTK